ncbi:DUF1178 family protein [Sphingomonas bacterium]|uniref:DUF1178 family protein n=1 Tax=Sphingomonas bacterium TaxID=1895847 RepID=UPI0015752C9B|nr:DUF1178 family protein [Sphingomonas bacterium]
MIVFDLRCSGGHVFEAWFTSSAAFEAQSAAYQVRCPICDDADVTKALMAPNIPAKANRTTPALRPDQAKTLLKALATAQANALKSSEWVGPAFADRARAMHDGEETPATIHGQATPAEAKALVDDGVPVLPLLLPVAPPQTKH